jgi:hypothetical protein
MISLFSGSLDSCGHFEANISPISRFWKDFSHLEGLKTGAWALESTGSPHLVNPNSLLIGANERGVSKLLYLTPRVEPEQSTPRV